MTRPTMLTPDVAERIVNTLSTGATIADTCAYVGIDVSTYHRWVQRGERARKGDEIYVDFRDAVTRARVAARMSAITIIKRSILEGNSDDAKWLLERSDPANWGRKDMIISLGLDPAILKELKQRADAVGVDLAQVFEAMVNELGSVSADRRAE